MKCIVVPIYKEYGLLSIPEKASLNQLFKILSRYTIFFICPRKFDTKGYFEIDRPFNSVLKKVEFEECYFQSIAGYNKLLLSIDFYKQFKKYQYILIYQTDAFVFKDELEYWCRQGYDYIGAPWFEGFANPVSAQIVGVGNGGFSLRRPKTYIRMLNRVHLIQKIQSICSGIDNARFSYSLLLLRLLNFWLKLKTREHLYYLQEDDFLNEDVFWGRNMSAIFRDFKVAPAAEALRFSFEANPSYLFKVNHEQLPFGCHAWEKHEPQFWAQFIACKKAGVL